MDHADQGRQGGHATSGNGGSRLAAWGALGAAALALVVAVVSWGRTPGDLLLAVVGVALVVTGGWYVVAHRGWIRGAALALAALGVLVLGWALVRADAGLARGLVVLALAGASVACARVASGRQVSSVTAADLWTAAPPVAARHPVLLMNPKSGGGKVQRFNLVEECRARGIEPVVLEPGDDLLELARQAVARGADVLGMAGGDGSQALVASVAMEHGLPHVVVPAGTRNHLALDLGLDRDDVVGALDAFTGGLPRTIDLATVNGRVFVNNASLGLYADIVASQEYRDAKVRTALDTLPDLLGPGSRTLDLRHVDGQGVSRETAHVILVSNNPYVLGSLGGLGTRERMDTAALGVATLVLTSAADARRFIALEAAGQVERFPGWQQWTTSRFQIDSGGDVEVGVDGEALTMAPPVVFEIIPAALTVLLPPQAPGRSPAARRITRNTPKELWDIALGRG